MELRGIPLFLVVVLPPVEPLGGFRRAVVDDLAVAKATVAVTLKYPSANGPDRNILSQATLLISGSELSSPVWIYPRF